MTDPDATTPAAADERDEVSGTELVEGLIADLAVVASDVKAAAATAASAKTDTAALATGLEVLDARIAALEQPPPDKTTRWPLYATLDEWVDQWLIPTFRLQQLLRDWRDHPAYVSELQASWLGYIHMARGKPGPEAMGWHGYLAAAIDRIRRHDRDPIDSVGLDTIAAIRTRALRE